MGIVDYFDFQDIYILSRLQSGARCPSAVTTGPSPHPSARTVNVNKQWPVDPGCWMPIASDPQYLKLLGGVFKYFLFSPLFGEDEPNLTNIFQVGWNHQPELHVV